MITTQELDKLTKPQLIELATDLGLTFDATQPKAVIHDLIAERLKNESEETSEKALAEHNDETANEAEPNEENNHEEVVPQENTALRKAMAIELAKRSVHGTHQSKNNIKVSFQEELARRAARYGSSYSNPTDIATALNNEIARRQVKSKGRK